MKITKLETALLQVIAINEFNVYNSTPLDDKAEPHDTLTNEFTLTDDWGELILLENGSTNKNPLHKGNIAGVIGSAVKKGLVLVHDHDYHSSDGYGNRNTIEFTQKGLDAYRSVANDLV